MHKGWARPSLSIRLRLPHTASHKLFQLRDRAAVSNFTETTFTSSDGLRLFARDYAPHSGPA
jgi:hypothetical protein